MSEDAGVIPEPPADLEPAADAPLEPGMPAAYRSPGPTLLVLGIWFGGALLWVSSILLVLDELRAVTPGGGAVLWVHGAALALYATVVGSGPAEVRGRQVALRASVILVIGLATLAAAAFFIALLGPGGARPAYVMLGMLGMIAFFVAQWRARKSLPPQTRRTATLVAAAEGMAAIATAIVYTLG